MTCYLTYSQTQQVTVVHHLMYLCYSTDRPREVAPCPPLHRGSWKTNTAQTRTEYNAQRYKHVHCTGHSQRTRQGRLLKISCCYLYLYFGYHFGKGGPQNIIEKIWQNWSSYQSIVIIFHGVVSVMVLLKQMCELQEVWSQQRRTHCTWLVNINVPLFLTSSAIAEHNLPYLEVDRYTF